MRILLGVSGGIAAYKAVLVLRQLREEGHRVRVIPTRAALDFVGSPTWAALSGETVSSSVFDGVENVDHVRLGREADLVLVVPATADLLARAAHGRSDDLLTATLLTTTAPVVLAPAMHTEMWQHPATRANVATLRSHGARILEPDAGRLTGHDSGPGRLPDPERIVAYAWRVQQQLRGRGELSDRTVTISAGGTREPLDPVRFLGNRSSGRQGVELARAAAEHGARVHLAAANIEPGILAALPSSVTCHPVETTAELEASMSRLAADADLVIMAAAVADFRPADTAGTKIKKRPDGSVAPIELVQNPDILAGLVSNRRATQVIVGFGAETGDDDGSVVEHGRRKARRKAADVLAVNAVGTATGFGEVPNTVHLLTGEGDEIARISGSKAHVADQLISTATDLLNRRTPASSGTRQGTDAGTLGS